MRYDEECLEKEKMCRSCGCKLHSSDSIKAGYCVTCASNNSNARKAWKDKGLAKFCSCGQMLHAQESIDSGKCSVCKMRNSSIVRSG